MRTFSMAMIAIIPGGAMTMADDNVATAEMQKLQGTWQLISATKDGAKTSDETVRKIRVVIRDGKHSVYIGDEIAVEEIRFAVDPTKDPWATTDTLPDGKEIKGIYKLDGDTLTSCVAEAGKDRPVEFASHPGLGHTLRVFHRVRP